MKLRFQLFSALFYKEEALVPAVFSGRTRCVLGLPFP